MNSRFLISSLTHMVPYQPGEQPKDRPYIKLNTNESPYPPSPAALEAVRAEAAGLRLYNDPSCAELSRTLADYHALDPAQIFVANGADEALMYAFCCFMSPQTLVSIPDISYEYYRCYLKTCGIPYRDLPVEGDLAICAEDYFDAPGPIVLTNPNAPSGLTMALPQIERVLQRNPDQLVILDEAYVDYGAQTALPLLQRYDNLLIVRTFSKSRNLAGMRIGYAMGSASLIGDMTRLKNVLNPYILDSIAQKSGVAAVEDEAYFRDCTNKVIATRQQFARNLHELGFAVTDSRANFVFAKHAQLPGRELLGQLRKRGVLVRHYANERICDYVRISIGVPEDMATVTELLREILAASAL